MAMVVVAVVVVVRKRDSTLGSKFRYHHPRHIPTMVLPRRPPQHQIPPVQEMLSHNIELEGHIEGEIGITALTIPVGIDSGMEAVGEAVGGAVDERGAGAGAGMAPYMIVEGGDNNKYSRKIRVQVIGHTKATKP